MYFLKGFHDNWMNHDSQHIIPCLTSDSDCFTFRSVTKVTKARLVKHKRFSHHLSHTYIRACAHTHTHTHSFFLFHQNYWYSIKLFSFHCYFLGFTFLPEWLFSYISYKTSHHVSLKIGPKHFLYLPRVVVAEVLTLLTTRNIVSSITPFLYACQAVADKILTLFTTTNMASLSKH